MKLSLIPKYLSKVYKIQTAISEGTLKPEWFKPGIAVGPQNQQLFFKYFVILSLIPKLLSKVYKIQTTISGGTLKPEWFKPGIALGPPVRLSALKG